jgi:hypothetical protein
MLDYPSAILKYCLRLKHLLIVLLSWSLAISTETAYAWSPGGHRVVAYVAWLQLDNETRAKAVELIKQHERYEEDFVERMPPSVADGSQETKDQWSYLQAATWPDIARNEPQFHHAKWHYVNYPYFVRPEDKAALDLSRVNVEAELPATITDENDLNILQAMLLNEQMLHSDSSTNQQKGLHLCWLMHLVGDVHQPLHSTALFTAGVFSDDDGDRGGNQIEVDGSNLHATWDNLLGNPTTIGNIGSRAEEAIDEFAQQGSKAAQSMDGLIWAQESHQLAKEAVYTKAITDVVLERDDDGGSSISVRLPQEYMTNAGSIARERAVEAGFRLAKAIEETISE